MGKTRIPSNILFWSILIAAFLVLSRAGGFRGYQLSGQDAWTPGPKTSAPACSVGEAKVRQNLGYGNIPLYFIPNKGQVNEDALFYARASCYTLWLTAEGLVFDRSVSKERTRDLAKPCDEKNVLSREKGRRGETQPVDAMFLETGRAESGPGEAMRTKTPHGGGWRAEDQRGENIRDIHRLVFMGANADPTIKGEGGTGHIANYFIGSDSAKWRTNIATSRAAVYKELYPNIDLKVYGVEKQIEYDWLVKPGGDPEAIDFAYQDVFGTEIDAEGDLIIRTELGEFCHRQPIAYQDKPDGGREPVEARFRKIGPDRYGFAVGSYDPTRPLVIDPVVLIYSTYLGGGSYHDVGSGITIDSSGHAYVVGWTGSVDFPTRNPFQVDYRWGDCFVTKFTATGNDLVYSTFLGGSRDDYGSGIALDNSGCAHITGYTCSADFPTQNAFKENKGGGLTDAFVAKISESGNGLIYSTYIGGFDSDYGNGIAVGNSGCAYVTGYTYSADFPTRNPFQGVWRWTDCFVARFTQDGHDLVYSTFLGGHGGEIGNGIVVDSSGCAYVTGETTSSDFPTRNPFQARYQGGRASDCFITKLAAAGDDLIYSTYLGGGDKDSGYGIALENLGCVYITGYTYSLDFPVRNPFQPNKGGGYADAFVAKLAAAGDDLVYSTYLGGCDTDIGYGISIDSFGCASVTGSTYSADFPTRSPFQLGIHGYGDVFVAKILAADDGLAYSTYLGGSFGDYGYGIVVDGMGCAYITGRTYNYGNDDFPTRNAFQANIKGNSDAFVTKLDLVPTVTAAVSGAGGSVSPATQTVVAGELATINIYPDMGYAIASITDNGDSVNVANPYVIESVREDHDVVVTFVRVYTVTGTVSGGHGSVSPATQTVVSGGTAIINIYPDLGYHIGSIRDNGVSVAVANPYVINDVREDHSVVVTFANEPPTVKIVSPAAGAKVFGTITVKAEATDDMRVLKVAFFVDGQLVGEDAFAESTDIYTHTWDTRGYAYGTHKIRVVAYDEAGLTAEHEITVLVENLSLALQGQRLTDRAWILRKVFVRLTIGIQNPGQVSVAKYVIYRKTGSGDYQIIKEVMGSEVGGQGFVWDDKTIEKNTQYTYRTVGLSSGGIILGISNEVTL